MILQALTECYEELNRQGKIPPIGWGVVGVSYALCIDAQGNLERAVSIKTEQLRGKKTVLAKQNMILPARIIRSSGIASNFLCENSSYALGVDNKEKPQRAKECFTEARCLHHKILDHVDSHAAKALLAFFDSWNPDEAASHPALQEIFEDITAGPNLVFRFDGIYIHEDPGVRQAWDAFYHSTCQNGQRGICLVTGQEDVIEAVHPAIKNVQGAQSSGASLVSFNAEAFCSYGKEQNFNAPVGRYAAFAYTTALNYLLADRERVFRTGDTTVVFWAKSCEDPYRNLMNLAAFDTRGMYTGKDISDLVKALCQGQKVIFEETMLDPDMKFYILGLSPNAARLSVRFFLQNSFGNFLRNVQAHHQRMEIVRPSFDKFDTVPLWKMLDETVNQNSRNKAPAPNLAGETLRAILNNTTYPMQLRNGVGLRIRADREINRGRASIIKAFYLKNRHQQVPEEVLTVSLNPDSTNIPYTLGRLFSVLEDIQQNASDGQLNATIKDRYFNAASATPAHVFPILINLAQKHLKKIKVTGKKGYTNYNILLEELIGKLADSYPTHLSIPQQGAFQLGYYHQTQARYTSNKTNGGNENG